VRYNATDFPQLESWSLNPALRASCIFKAKVQAGKKVKEKGQRKRSGK